jgi:hypothetical protein
VIILVIVIAAWLCIGSWLAADGVRGALPIIRQQYGRENVGALVFAFAVGCIWLPVPFFRAMFRK